MKSIRNILKWFCKPKNIIEFIICVMTVFSFFWVLLAGIPDYRYNKKIRKFSYSFELENKFPEYGEEDKAANGVWIHIPYTFINDNDYSIYYRVNWKIFAEDRKGVLVPTANYFSRNFPDNNALKNKTDENFIRGLIGRPQIDLIKEQGKDMQLQIILEIWDKQGEVPLPEDKPNYRYMYFYKGYFTAENKFRWDEVVPFVPVKSKVS